MKAKRIFWFGWLILLCLGCQNNAKKQQKAPSVNYYEQNAGAVVSIHTFDHFNQKIKEGYGFFVAPDLVVTNLDWLQGAFKARLTAMDGKALENITGYMAVDLDRNLVLLHTGKRNQRFLKLDSVALPDSVYSLLTREKKLFVLRSPLVDSASHGYVNGDFNPGKPLFNGRHQLAGMVQQSGERLAMVPADSLLKFLKTKNDGVTSLYELRLLSKKDYPHYSKIDGFNIVTDKGTIRIRLSNKVPEYRDNFIRLVSDHFYDSLLVHRVINSFLIQTGAADSKFAGRDDVVGWQGPGYTLPMQVNTGLYHKRGAVAASKLPPERNPKNRSDGSQFYIVAGRVFSHAELDELEKQKGIKFSAEQRSVYTTEGGAPYLDGDYTVFGEVDSGLDVVDQISKVEVYSVDRPLKDIRVRRIEPIYKP